MTHDRSVLQRTVAVGTGLAVFSAALAGWNRITMARLVRAPSPVEDEVTVCVPARDEADRLPGLIADLRAQTGIPRMRVLIFDDDSGDGTYAAAEAAVDGDPRFTVVRGIGGPPPGWTGKAAACARLADIAFGETHGEAADTRQAQETAETGRPQALVFVDADVRVAPDAVAAAVGELRARRAALVSPWPLQETGSVAEALVQPLLCWSWAASLPMTVSGRSIRPSTVVACGQFLVFDAAAYRAIDGHAAVASSVTEDLDIARHLRRRGYRTTAVAAGPSARTRMYRGAAELEAGYSRWLWSAYRGSVTAGAVVGGLAALAFLLPPLAAVFGGARLRQVGALGYGAAVVGRLLARGIETGDPPRAADLVAASAHPVSVAAYLTLWARSHRAHRKGSLRWKGRRLPRTGAARSGMPGPTSTP